MNASGQHCIVVDTNVLAVAEGLHVDATEQCRAACVDIARRIKEGLTVVVDADGLIVAEYVQALAKSHTAGVGTKLARVLRRQQNDSAKCCKVKLTPSDEPPGSFEEVPQSLRDFDVDDHKFIGVAAVGGSQIYQAVDREWWGRRHDFAACGVDVQFLCATYLMDVSPG
jgi:hypothetical protein